MAVAWEEFTAADEPETQEVDWSQFEAADEPSKTIAPKLSAVQSGTEFRPPAIVPPLQDIEAAAPNLHKAVEYAGNIARAIPADVAAGASLFKRPQEQPATLFPSPSAIAGAVQKNLPAAAEASGNIPAAVTGHPMPIDEILSAASKEDKVAATIGKISQGLAATAPMLGIAALPAAAQKLALIGFTAKMISDVPHIAKELGDELGKPEDQRDPDKLTTLISEAIQVTGFSALGLKSLASSGLKTITDYASKYKPTEVQNALVKEATQPVRPVQPQPLESTGQVPAKEGGEAVGVGGGETAKGEASGLPLNPVWKINTRRYLEEGYKDASVGPEEKLSPKSIAESDEHGATSPELIAAYKAGEKVTPIVVEKYPDGTVHVVDGSTRLNSAIAAEAKEIPVQFVKYGDTPGGGMSTKSAADQARQAEANRKMQEEFGAEVEAAPDLREPPSVPNPSEPVTAPERPEASPLGTAPAQASAAKPVESDWSSATDSVKPIPPETGEVGKAPEFPKIEPQELGAGLSLPQFKIRKMTPLDVATASHSAKMQRSESNARRAVKEIRKITKNEDRQAAVAIAVEAGGDIPTLQGWANNARGAKFKKAAIDAQTMTPEETALASKIIRAFDALYSKGTAHDVVTNFRDNYITHIWETPKKTGGFGAGKLKQNFKFNKARTFATFFEGDQAGFIPKTLALDRIVPAYIKEMDSVIAARQFVKDMAGQFGSDGRPLVIPRGTARAVPGGPGSATLVFPNSTRNAKDAMGIKVDQSDYKTMENQPALQKWSWVAKDEAGNPIMLQSDLSLHPEALKRIHSMLGTSALKEWYQTPSIGAAQIPKAIAKGLDAAQSEMKKSMFGMLAPFHQVQEGWHGIGHTVNPFFGIPKVDLRNPAQLDAAAHGLMLLPDRASSASYLEGSGSQSSLLVKGMKKVPGLKVLGELSDAYQDYLFHQYIPGMKFKTYEHILERNTKRYAPELASGEVSAKDLKLLSAEQSNAAYGHLNYALIDRNPTIQHLLRIGLLAPDFLEARGRFTGQAIKGLSGKVGQEQLRAIAFLAAVQAGSSIVISQLLGVPWDPKHPFEVVYKGRRYTMRSVPEDLFSLKNDPRSFWYSRINPLIAKGGIQYTTGQNYRGEKVTAPETTAELLAGYIPITARSIPGLRDLTFTGKNQPVSPIEQLAGSLGLRISRYSPISETYKLAHDWTEKEGMPTDRGSYPVSKYQQLRYALEDNDTDAAVSAYQELLKTATRGKIASGFHESIAKPFTGSQETDTKFSKSLTGYDRELYNLAVQRRKDILNRFNAMPKPAPK